MESWSGIHPWKVEVTSTHEMREWHPPIECGNGIHYWNVGVAFGFIQDFFLGGGTFIPT